MLSVIRALSLLTKFGAGNETRTRDPDLGKVVLYQLSYSRLAVIKLDNLLTCFIFRQTLLPFDALHSTVLGKRVNKIIRTSQLFAAF